jgi:hypothetical protein
MIPLIFLLLIHYPLPTIQLLPPIIPSMSLYSHLHLVITQQLALLHSYLNFILQLSCLPPISLLIIPLIYLLAFHPMLILLVFTLLSPLPISLIQQAYLLSFQWLKFLPQLPSSCLSSL